MLVVLTPQIRRYVITRASSTGEPFGQGTVLRQVQVRQATHFKKSKFEKEVIFDGSSRSKVEQLYLALQ
jgi:hypothetical protein